MAATATRFTHSLFCPFFQIKRDNPHVLVNLLESIPRKEIHSSTLPPLPSLLLETITSHSRKIPSPTIEMVSGSDTYMGYK
jgi:hypothetical protein